jgi:hypothetical protein
LFILIVYFADIADPVLLRQLYRGIAFECGIEIFSDRLAIDPTSCGGTVFPHLPVQEIFFHIFRFDQGVPPL